MTTERNDTSSTSISLLDNNHSEPHKALSTKNVLHMFRDPVTKDFFEVMDTYVMPITIALGLVSNMTAFLIFLLTKLKTIPGVHFLAALAVTDSGFLLTFLLMIWLPKQNLDVYNRAGLCQLIIYSNYVFVFLSPWYLVTIMIERFITLYFPLSRARVCNTFRAKIIIISIAVLSIVAYLHITWMFGVDTKHGNSFCVPWLENINAYKILSEADTIVVFIIPYIIIFILLFLICVHVWQDCRTRRSLQRLQPNLQHNTTNSNSNDKLLKMTVIAITLAFISIILNLPWNVKRVQLTLNPPSIRYDSILYRCSQMLYYLNHAIKFFIYLTVSVGFRQQIRSLVGQMINRILRRTAASTPPENILVDNLGERGFQPIKQVEDISSTRF